MLERFRKAQEPAVKKLLALEGAGNMPAPYAGARPPFASRLLRNGPGAVIAEYKRASPAQGEINLLHGPEEIAAAYAGGGASALSVLTEGPHFKGGIAFLDRMKAPGLPLLRKDFLVHPLQVAETAATPASALLLIARMLDPDTLAAMLKAAQRHGLEAVLEVFSPADLEKARRALRACDASPAIIQVNNRDLDTLAVSEAPSRELVRQKREGEVWISASGIKTREQVLERAALGFDAVLVGAFPMSRPQPGEALAVLTGRTTQDGGT